MIAEDTVHPDPKVSLRAWDESWADALETSCNRPLATHRRLWDTLDINLSVVSSPMSQPSQESRMALDKMTREVCTLQNDLAKAFVQKCIHNDFELKWWDQTRQRLEEVILEGIYRATCVAWLGNQRKMCPEISLRALSSDDGLPYLELVKKVLPPMLASETVAITEPTYVSHPVVDHILSLTPREARVPIVQHQMQVAKVSRMYFLTMALWNIFLVYHGEEEEYATSKAFRPTAQDKEWLKAIVTGNAHVERNMHRRTLREFEQERRSQVVACWGCGKAQSTLPAGTTPFQACNKCNAIGRRILYCSRDCQRKDWSHGVPRPHKAFCGKAQPTSELEDLSTATKVQDTSQIMRGRIPDPDPSFHRPPALLHQLTFLRQPPYCDYTFIFPYPLPDQGFSFPPTNDTISAKDFFLLARNRALRTGDKESVSFMFQALHRPAAQFGMSKYQLQKQLESEYGLTLEGTDDGKLKDLMHSISESATDEEWDAVTECYNATYVGMAMKMNGEV